MIRILYMQKKSINDIEVQIMQVQQDHLYPETDDQEINQQLEEEILKKNKIKLLMLNQELKSYSLQQLYQEKQQNRLQKMRDNIKKYRENNKKTIIQTQAKQTNKQQLIEKQRLFGFNVILKKIQSVIRTLLNGRKVMKQTINIFGNDVISQISRYLISKQRNFPINEYDSIIDLKVYNDNVQKLCLVDKRKVLYVDLNDIIIQDTNLTVQDK